MGLGGPPRQDGLVPRTRPTSSRGGGDAAHPPRIRPGPAGTAAPRILRARAFLRWHGRNAPARHPPLGGSRSEDNGSRNARRRQERSAPAWRPAPTLRGAAAPGVIPTRIFPCLQRRNALTRLRAPAIGESRAKGAARARQCPLPRRGRGAPARHLDHPTEKVATTGPGHPVHEPGTVARAFPNGGIARHDSPCGGATVQDRSPAPEAPPKLRPCRACSENHS